MYTYLFIYLHMIYVYLLICQYCCGVFPKLRWLLLVGPPNVVPNYIMFCFQSYRASPLTAYYLPPEGTYWVCLCRLCQVRWITVTQNKVCTFFQRENVSSVINCLEDFPYNQIFSTAQQHFYKNSA